MMRSRAVTRCGVLRRCMPTCTTRLYLRAAASIAWPSTTSTLIGFCTQTSRPIGPPRSSAARASGRACRSGRCRGRARAASRDSRCRSAASSSRAAASRRGPRPPRPCADPRHRARPRPPAPPAPAEADRSCRTSRSRSGPTRFRMSASCCRDGGSPASANAAALFLMKSRRSMHMSPAYIDSRRL